MADLEIDTDLKLQGVTDLVFEKVFSFIFFLDGDKDIVNTG